ncbi:MAG: hypothetical protein GC161_09550 [Planctomycetaceae bacterium]|nr:hypothetical protein [Planctomycetaceae bacterium]
MMHHRYRIGWRASSKLVAALLPLLWLSACAGPSLPQKAPPLADMEEPPAWLVEPADEAARLKLAPGSFSGVRVRDGRQSLDALVGDPEGLEVASVVENSPAAAAGLEAGDLLLEVLEPEAEVVELLGSAALAYPSQWRALELGFEPGTEVVVLVDRAGRERRARFTLTARAAPPERQPAERLREELRVGLVLRTATEVEARSAQLSPGAGAVVVGLSRSSPWRRAGIVFGDLIVSIDGRPVLSPGDVLDAIRLADEEEPLVLLVARGEERFTIAAPVGQRRRETKEVRIPLLFHFERAREQVAWSAILGLVRYDATPAAWKMRLLWFIRFGRGDADRLESLDG